jgi:hypothetical protein
MEAPMSKIIGLPAREQRPPAVITVGAYWNGPLFYFDVSAPNDVHLATTNSFDVAIRAAFEYAQTIGLDGVRFALTSEDMRGGVA